jgi:sugar phosphate isomerase/epimerase
MLPGIWTSFYFDLPPEDAFRRFAILGFRDLEVSAEHGKMATQDSNWKERLKGLRKLCEKEDITLWQMHAPLELDVADQDPKKREADLQTVVRWIEYSYGLGIPHLVIHPGGRQKANTEEEKKQILMLNLDAFSQLGEVAGRFNVKLCIENMQEREGQDPWRLGARIWDINELINAVGSDALGICFDSSHANVTKLDFSKAIHECGSRLLATHISDNDGSGDQHKMPFYGNINWETVISAMKEVGYSYLFNLEIPGENRAPLAIRDARLSYAKEILGYMIRSF